MERKPETLPRMIELETGKNLETLGNGYEKYIFLTRTYCTRMARESKTDRIQRIAIKRAWHKTPVAL